jgi:pilus assembly protein CpaB
VFRRRWSTTSKVFAVLAVAGAVATFVLVRGYATKLAQLRPAVGRMVPVVVAAAPVERGSTLTNETLRVAQMPSAFLPPGALRSTDQVLGETASSDMAAGEPITRTRLGAMEAGPVASLVPSGLRAFPVQAEVPPRSIRPGDGVDVLATFGGPHPHTETVASGLEVLLILDHGGSTAATLTSPTADGATLVLLVSPDQAEHLAYAKAFADLAITIDAPADRGGTIDGPQE